MSDCVEHNKENERKDIAGSWYLRKTLFYREKLQLLLLLVAALLNEVVF